MKLIAKCALILISFLAAPNQSNAQIQPPFTDYCEMLARDIQGKAHGFMAGNLMYYVGGQTTVEWDVFEHETLGFTHPYFRDGRSRGHGIVTDKYGTGHDKWGWEFWRQVRGAYGTVIVDGERFPYPVPKEMIWRPDRQICRYEVGGVKIEEHKFIALNDVVCTIITADRPVTLEFDGHSYVNTNHIPTFDHDPENTPFSQERAATARYDTENNAIHIVEKGTAIVKPEWREKAVTGRMMYDGMSLVLSASVDLAQSHTLHRDEEGRQVYTFQVPADQNGIAIIYAMDDDYAGLLPRVKSVLENPQKALAEKTKHVNDWLNYQIPYFRCPDKSVVKTYYYLWALYFMYFMNADEGWEAYPHTQTAVNNFMGLHIWDASAFFRMGTWVADKQKYGYGNLLTWKAMLPFKNERNMLPDNFGIAWWSPVWQHFEHVAEGTWQMYAHSGDREFLREAYAFLKGLYWDGGPDMVFGFGLNLLDDLIAMAAELGETKDIRHWQQFRQPLVKTFQAGWEVTYPNYYGNASRWKDSWHLAWMLHEEAPQSWIDGFVREYIMNTETGFMGPIPMENRPPDNLENGVFAVSTLASYQAIEGMFRHHRDAEAIHCLLGHINGMNKDHGYPVAPEAWDPDYKPWGDLYYNWDGAVNLPIIKRLIGVDYSLVDDALVVTDHLPKHWDYIESYVPVVIDGNTNWVKVNITKEKGDNKIIKKVSIDGNPLKNLILRPWLEDRKLLSEDPGFNDNNTPRGHLQYIPENSAKGSIELALGENQYDFPLLVYVKPLVRDFVDSATVELIGLMHGSDVFYTLDGSEPSRNSLKYRDPIHIKETTTFTVRAFREDEFPGPVKTITYRKIVPREPDIVSNISPGVHYQLFEGKWQALPDFDALQPFETGIAPQFEISVSPKDEEFGAVFSGYVEIPRDGIYTFHTRSNDGSRIYIGDSLVVDLNVWRTHFDPLDKYGSIALKAGLHPIKVEFFQDYGRKHLQIFYEGPALNRQIIPAAALFHKMEN